MTRLAPASTNRVRALPAFLGFTVLGLLPLWLGLSSLVPSARAVLAHAPLVSVSPRDAIGLPLALLCFALAGMTLCPAAAVGPGRVPKRPRQFDWLKLWLGVAATAVLLTVVSILVAEIGASWLITDRGYAPCPAPAGERRAPLRWVVGGGRCPG